MKLYVCQNRNPCCERRYPDELLRHDHAGESTSLFRNTLRELLQSGARKLLLDLEQVTYIDSSGIGELVGAYTSAANVNAKIKLAKLPAKIYDLLQITKLVTVFEIFDDEAEAIRSFE